jgi:hypothetical protein
VKVMASKPGADPPLVETLQLRVVKGISVNLLKYSAILNFSIRFRIKIQYRNLEMNFVRKFCKS